MRKTILVIMLACFAPMALAEEKQKTIPPCAPLVVENGLVRSAGYSAHHFSKLKPGNVGISMYVGQDLDGAKYTPEQISRYLVKEIEKGSNLDAECFISSKKSPKGTSIAFTVYGIEVPQDENGLNVIQAIDEKTIQAVRGEANLVRLREELEL